HTSNQHGTSRSDSQVQSSGHAGNSATLSGTARTTDNNGRPDTFGIARATLLNPTTLEVYYGQPYAPCYGDLGRVEVDQGAHSVTITLHRDYSQVSNEPQMCSHMIMLKPVKIHLKEA